MADTQPGSDTYIEGELKRRIEELEKLLKSDIIACVVPIYQPVDDLIRDAIEDYSANGTAGKDVRDYYRLLQDYMGRRGHKVVINTREDYKGF